jgi:16S rRNA (cytosine1402-N4)-methyltransferase
VNGELERLEQVLPQMAQALVPGGRLLVITFHSLEDRLVKYSFRDLEDKGVGFVVNKKVVQAAWGEKKSNPRSRSAKLRVFQKGERA